MISSKLLWFILSHLFISFFIVAESSASNKLHQGELNGKELTVLAYQMNPLFTYKKLKDGNYTFEGIFKHMLDDVKDYLNIRFKYIILDQNEVIEYGFWEALYKILERKEVDIVPFSLVQDFDTLKYVELAAAIWIDPMKILQRWPDEQSRLAVTIRPFQPTVWLFFFITTTVFVFTTAAFIRNRYKNDDNIAINNHESIGATIFNQAENVFRIMTNQGSSGSHTTDRSSYKILTAIWLLSMVVLINGYSGVLTSYLTIPKLNPIVNTIQEVAERKELRVTVEKNVPISKLFMDAKGGYEKVLGDQLRKDPRLLVPDIFAALENVVHFKAAYPGVDSMINFMIGEDVKTNGYCRFTTSSELRDYASFAFQWGFPKGSLYASAFSEMTLRFWANGIIAYSKNIYFRATSKCRTDNPPETRIGSLTLLDLSPAFLILGLGLLLSILCFLLEIITQTFFFM